MQKHYVIGIDFGSDSVRALIVDALTGAEVASAVAEYERWRAGKYQDPQKSMFRQHPEDYIEALIACLTSALKSAGEDVRRSVAALSVDTTGSTPCPVDREGTPLAMLPEFAEDPDAMFHLWKDHTAVEEAEEISRAFQKNADGIDYTRYQGRYASEWYWAKILHTSRRNKRLQEKAYTWVEHCDWIPALLTGKVKPDGIYRCACAAGHKAYWHSSWGGLPSEACLRDIDPLLARLRGIYGTPKPATCLVGTLSKKWADRLALDESVLVGGSSLDAHAGAVGAGIADDTMIVNLGTSAVNLLVVPQQVVRGKRIAWAAGAAEDSVIPGMIGLESGQAAFGDVYAWLRHLLCWPLREIATSKDRSIQEAILQEMEERLLNELQKAAESIPIEDAPIALDWFNGRRYPYVNEFVCSAVAGLNMGTDAPALYRALLTATALGQRRILDTLAQEGVSPQKIVAVGGIAQKSSLLMQTLADALDRQINVSQTQQACARGAAMYAAVAAGIYPDIQAAQARMCEGIQQTYVPRREMRASYEQVYAKYLRLATFMDDSMRS